MPVDVCHLRSCPWYWCDAWREFTCTSSYQMNPYTRDRRTWGMTHDFQSWFYVLLCLLSHFVCPWILTAASGITYSIFWSSSVSLSHIKPLKSFITNTVQLHWSMVSKSFQNTDSCWFFAVVLFFCLTSSFYCKIWRCLQCCPALGIHCSAENFYRSCGQLVPGFWDCNKVLHRAFTATDSEKIAFCLSLSIILFVRK